MVDRIHSEASLPHPQQLPQLRTEAHNIDNKARTHLPAGQFRQTHNVNLSNKVTPNEIQNSDVNERMKAAAAGAIRAQHANFQNKTSLH